MSSDHGDFGGDYHLVEKWPGIYPKKPINSEFICLLFCSVTFLKATCLTGALF